jgi:hypothetical protein
VNEPTTGARTIVTRTQAGTYTVNCKGTGQFLRLVTANTGLAATQIDDFVITAGIVFNGQLIATGRATG